MITCLALAYSTAQTKLVTPYTQVYKIQVSAPAIPSLKTFEMFEMEVDAKGTFNNPFDPADAALDLLVENSERKFSVPGFWTAPFERRLNGTTEELTRSGSPGWKIRWTPTEPGTYQVRVRFKDQTDTFITPAQTVTVSKGNGPGFVAVGGKDPRYFVRSDGRSVFPVGTNLCWASPRGTYDYDDWLPKLSANGANFGRLWLSPEIFTFGIERKGKPEEGLGMGQFDLGRAWKIDYVLQSAAKQGIDIKLCIDSFNILRQRDSFNYWEQTPHNRDHGGPLRIWSDFWTDAKMDRLYQNKLRYLVARYGAYTNMFAWEFWNECDITTDFDPVIVKKWHQRMSTVLRALDPYKHLQTTSFSAAAGVRDIDAMPELDYVQTHHYSSPDIVGTIINQQVRKASLDKPHYVGEIGADWTGPRAEEDPTGLQVHDPMWASIVSGGAGAAMPWWWDSLTAPKDLFKLFKPVSEFTKGINFSREEFRVNRPTIAFQTPPKVASYQDVEISGGPEAWEPAPQNQPQRVKISRTGAVTGNVPVSGLLHGQRNHPTWHNPVAFSVNFERKTRFEVDVRGVSGYGGARIEIWVDNERVAAKPFNAPENAADGAIVKKYNGKYGVDLSPGNHSVAVRNNGNDWVQVSYRFKDAVKLTKPALDVWALNGRDYSLIWMRPTGRSWRAVIEEKRTFPKTIPAMLGLKGLAPGRWEVQYWNTWTGDIFKRANVSVSANGAVRIPVPSFEKDLAIRVNRK